MPHTIKFMKKLLLSVAALFTVTVLIQAGETATDICGNTYPVVTIGTQIWMAENLRCNKYDTDSEAYSIEWPAHNTLLTPTNSSYLPYYVDATNLTNWDKTSKEMSYRIREELVAKLGYLYNWAAAVGVGDGLIYKDTFVGHRQGICPNGWHIPTKGEWDKLVSNITGEKEYGGKRLKKTSGWYCSRIVCGNGTDDYGFAALPAGYADGNVISKVVDEAYFWTSTTLDNGEEAYNINLSNDSRVRYYANQKNSGASVRCVKNTIIVSTEFETLESDGGTVEIVVSSDIPWSASSSQDWARPSKTMGEGSEIITISVDKSTSQYMDTARITFFAKDQTPAVVVVCLKPGLKIPEKCKASDYSQVVIGSQIWMAENYRCSKYDTGSEAYNASWLTNNTIPTTVVDQSTPYYLDAADMSMWNDNYSNSLSRTQISKLGYLYNWSAVVGIDKLETQTESFSGDRQGICPNGWHVPSLDEISELLDYVGGADVAGAKLKTMSGWFKDGNGTDDYGFAALPANVDRMEMWSSSYFHSYSTYACQIISGRDRAFLHMDFNTAFARSVRCVKSLSTATEETNDDTEHSVYKQLIGGHIVIINGNKKFNLQGGEIK